MIGNILMVSLIIFIIIIFIVIGLLLYEMYLNNIYNRKIRIWTEKLEEKIPILDFIKDRSIYLMKETYDDLTSSCNDFPKLFIKYKKQFSKWKYKGYIEIVTEILKKDFFDEYNKAFIDKSLHDKSVLDLLNNIDNKTLDLKQKEVVISDERNTLVVAGAGSGKTLTISGKTQYLTKILKVDPKEILLITYTNKASEEMKKRIKEKLNIDINVFTFHKLGLNILAKHMEHKPLIASDSLLSNTVSKYLEQDIFNDNKISTLLLDFFSYYFYTPIEDKDFNNLTEYYDEIKSNQLETLKEQLNKSDTYLEDLRIKKMTHNREIVKSYEELAIANYLYLNNINYEYERPYPKDVSDKKHMQYKPDFYLPDYDIYIEHYGINRNNKVPWLNSKMEKEYIKGIVWKRMFHKKEKNNYIETYSYYNSEGVLLKKLEEKLNKFNVKFKPKNKEEVLKHLVEKDPYFYDQFKKLIVTFINQYKSNGYKSFQQLREQKSNIYSNSLRAKIFLMIVEPIYKKYQDRLQNLNQIDFSDMINKSSDLIQQNKIQLNYKYIIVDEYQYISYTRYKLIDSIRKQCSSKLVVVGDDWQSIYRFAGSDVNLINDFEDMNKKATLTKSLEKTYRNSQELLDIIGKFIMRNGRQRKKSLFSDKTIKNPIRVTVYENNKLEAVKQSVEKIINEKQDTKEILLLGRYSFDNTIKLKDKNRDIISYLKKTYPKIRFKFLTIHKSKGLESEHVILLNAENSKLGFPSKINDDKLLDLVLPKVEPVKFAEERRLFYVALTRTKNIVYIIAPKKNPSVFIKELIDKHQLKDVFSDKSIICPKCSGKMVLKEDSFYGCENFPLCRHTVSVKADLSKNCPICGDYLVLRKGKYGKFYGCNSYKYKNDAIMNYCGYTKKVIK